MQPYRNNETMSAPVMMPEDAKEIKKKMQDMFNKGADEVKIFKATHEAVKKMTKNQLKRRRQRVGR